MSLNTGAYRAIDFIYYIDIIEIFPLILVIMMAMSQAAQVHHPPQGYFKTRISVTLANLPLLGRKEINDACGMSSISAAHSTGISQYPEMTAENSKDGITAYSLQ